MTIPQQAIPGLVVTRDSIDVTAILGSEVPVDPGEHSLSATAPNFIDYATTVIASGEGTTIEAPIPPLVAKPLEVKPLDPIRSEPALPRIEYDRSDQQRRRGISSRVILGGSLTVGLGLTLGAFAAKNKSDAQQDCTRNDTCSPLGAKKLRTAANFALAANIVVPLGVAGFVTGIVLWVKAPKPVAISTGLQIVPTTNGAAITGRF